MRASVSILTPSGRAARGGTDGPSVLRTVHPVWPGVGTIPEREGYQANIMTRGVIIRGFRAAISHHRH